MNQESIEQVIEEEVARSGNVLVDALVHGGASGFKGLVRVVIGSAIVGEDIGSDACTAVSRAVGQRLEEEGLDAFFAGRYLMEVSTPGLTRKLKTDRELSYGVGRRVEVRFITSLKVPPLTGVLKKFDESSFDIETDGTTQHVDRESVRAIQLNLL